MRSRSFTRSKKNDRCRAKAFIIITCCVVVAAVLLALCAFLMCFGSAPSLTLLAPAQGNEYAPIRNGQLLTKRHGNDAAVNLMEEDEREVEQHHLEKESQNQIADEMLSRHMQWGQDHQHQMAATQRQMQWEQDRQHQKAATQRLHTTWNGEDHQHHPKAATKKPHTAWNAVKKQEPEPKRTPEPEPQRGQHAESSIDNEGLAQRFVKSLDEDPKGGGEDADDIAAGSQDGDDGDGEQHREEPKPMALHELQRIEHPESSSNAGGGFPQEVAKSPVLVNANSPETNSRPDPDVDATLRDDSTQRERKEPVNSTQDNSLPPDHPNDSNRGTFWVCFPPIAIEENVKKYARVFNELARRQKWTVYPFCYIDTRRLEVYGDHFCDDVKKITFVLEADKKKNDVVPDKKREFSAHSEISINSSFDDCLKATEFALSDSVDSAWFRRTFRPGQHIEASVVEEFLDDAFSGKLQEIVSTKIDL